MMCTPHTAKETENQQILSPWGFRDPI